MCYLLKHQSADRCYLSRSICAGLAYLHQYDIVHGDLKGANVLIARDGRPMLVDFGNANLPDATLSFTQTNSQPNLSLRWTAPEILDGKSAHTTAGDIYSLGMTILETLTSEIPFANKSDQTLLMHVFIKKKTPPRPKNIIPERSICGNILWAILTSCWSYDPELRPSAEIVMDLVSGSIVCELPFNNGPRKKTVVLSSKVPVLHLALSDEQHRKITTTYQTPNDPSVTDIHFDSTHQAEAHGLLLTHKLGAESLNHPANKWCMQWSNGPKETYKHVLLQCYCGYNHQSRKSSTRRAPYDFTGCLAHVEIITVRATGAIARVHGMLMHNSECLHAKLKRIPMLELHPSVLEVALQQLNNGAALTEIKQKNRVMVAACQYRDQTESLGKYRYLLRHYDTGSLYTQYYRAQGIDIKEKPHLNIHNWLDPASKTYNPALARAIFHYSARTEQSARLEICIATDEMKEAAWRYGHQRQILLDGTFGVCDRRLLLFIVMGIDKQNHGVPLAFLLFSAPGGNKATQSGYNTLILVKVLGRWKDSLTLYRQQAFAPAVAITDTDFKERGALVDVFPGIKLLICRFHLRQRWTNNRAKCLRGNVPGHKAVRDRLVALECRLVESIDFGTAKSLVSQEIGALNQIAMNSLYASAAGKGITHLEYLSSTWMTEALWESWSDGGQFAAAEKIGMAVEGVVMTNNPLESFNGLLKHKLLKGWSRGGRRIRVDTLVFMLALKVAQSIFLRRRLEEDERNMLRKALEGVPGVDALIGAPGRATRKPIEAPVAYLSPDIRRDNEAFTLLQQRRLSRPVIHEKGMELTCCSLQSRDPSGAPVVYTVWLGFNAVAFCTCPDFQQRGGACKHMRAALIGVRDLKSWVQTHRINDPIIHTPNIELPANKSAAIRAITAQFGTCDQNTTQERAENIDSGPGKVDSAFERAARAVNEALEGGFLDESENIDELDEAGVVGSDIEDYEEGDMLSGDDQEALLSGDELPFPSKSAQGIAKQAIARAAYDFKRQINAVPAMNSALDHITHRDLGSSIHRTTYERFANEFEAITARVRGLLCQSASPFASQTSSQSNSQPPILIQRNTHTIPIPPSPERRQYRKESRGIH
ncbi:hypothetical protein RSOLAG22IIIB_13012 [Rhizoctonia solani]|uniref:Uncharacterized protein n=1 Tax=Rhizoctonia solani TaxID=456999 RepID=A0A0K6GHW8_9AGAM|nr:hypothetical protein RSOLAG22IIIB_13012 [Rhizoctonia solani]